MKIIKRILSVVMVVVMLLTAAPLNGFADIDWKLPDFSLKASAWAPECEYYSNVIDRVIIITRVGTSISGDVTIPSTVNGYPVTAIGEHAFSNCTRLTSITIPDSVTSIGASAFSGCTSLASITIPDSVTNIGSNAFSGTAYYSNDSNWEDGVLYIGNHLIKSKTTLISCDIKQSTKILADGAFSGCENLSSITIPYGVTKIGYATFGNCKSLSSITIPDSVTTIEDRAFYNCTSLTSITIPDSVTALDYEAFYECTRLASISIGNGITSIDEEAFRNFTSLTSITIGNGVTTIGSSAFSGCKNLTSVSIGNGVTSISSYAFYNCTSLTSIIVPDSVTSIDYSAFENCKNLASITIPDGVTSIGYSAFENCKNLASITIGNGVTTIGSSAFSGCKNLTSVSIGNGVTSIGSDAFYNCTSLTSITIPDSVTNIGSNAFSGTAYYSNDSNWEDGVLYIGNHLIKSKTTLISCDIKQSTKILANGAFSGCKNLTSIAIPDRVTSIGDRAFSNCTSLTSITIPDSVITIGEETFYNCTSLTSITIPDSVTTIEDSAFYYCTSLTNIIIPDSVISIGEGALNYCKSLTSITVDEDNKFYSSDSFGVLYNKTKTELIQCPAGNVRTEFTIPDSVTVVTDYAFNCCNKLINIELPDSITTIGEYAFGNCSKLETIIIPDSVTSIGDGAMSWCSNLKSITVDINNQFYSSDSFGVLYNKTKTKLIQYPGGNERTVYIIPYSVTSIGYDAFYNCINLTSVTIPDNVTSIGSYAFSGCTSLTGIIIPDSITYIGYYAFYSCDSLTDVYYTGTGKQWKEIEIGSYNNDLTGATIHYNSAAPDTPSSDIVAEIENVYGIDYTFTYNDNYFSESSYEYKHDLAIMSNCLALSAMIKSNSNALPNYAEKFYGKLDFDMDTYEYYGYGVSPQYNSIACVIASKNIPGTDETVIAIGVRGGGYDAEWGGNFNIGTAEEHEGFRQAKEGVLGYLNEYIAEHKDKFNSNIKFWISGYSRAAATSNLVASVLDNGAADYEEIASLNYYPDDVYAYTFETPIPTRDANTKNPLYSNIFNIINRIDYVPKVAPEAWGYSRYGVDVFLPSNETYGNEYGRLYNKMKAMYKQMTGDEYTNDFVFYDPGFSIGWDGISFVSENENYSQSRFLDELITLVAKKVIKNVPNYVNNYQSSVQKLTVATLGGGFEDVDIPDNTFSEILSMIVTAIISAITGKADATWRTGLAAYIANIEGYELTYTDAYNVLGIVDEALLTGAVGYNYVYTFFKNANIIKPAHNTDVNFAWVAALDAETIKQTINKKTYRVIKFNCPIDINLYDEEDNLLATVCGDNVEVAEDCYLTIYIDADGQKCFCLPEDTQYRFEIIGTDEGTMNCTFSEYDFAKGENTETVNYYNIPVEEDKQFFVEVDKKVDDGSDSEESIAEDIIFTDETEEIIESDEVISGEDITEYTVTAENSSENSVVIGGGTYAKGEFAKVEAFAAEGETFLGWYIDDVLVSEEASYRFMVENDCTVVAKWFVEEEEETTEPPDESTTIEEETTEPSTTAPEESTSAEEETTETTTAEETTTVKVEESTTAPTTKPTTTKKEENTKAPSTTKPTTTKKAEATTAPVTTTAPTTTAPTTATTEKEAPAVKVKKPGKVKIKKPKSVKKKTVVVTWKAVKNTNGYQVAYSTSKKFTKKATKTKLIKKAKTIKTTLKKLKSGKKYFIRVRAYKTVNGKKVYGAYSKVMTVKVK